MGIPVDCIGVLHEVLELLGLGLDLQQGNPLNPVHVESLDGWGFLSLHLELPHPVQDMFHDLLVIRVVARLNDESPGRRMELLPGPVLNGGKSQYFDASLHGGAFGEAPERFRLLEDELRVVFGGWRPEGGRPCRPLSFRGPVLPGLPVFPGGRLPLLAWGVQAEHRRGRGLGGAHGVWGLGADWEDQFLGVAQQRELDRGFLYFGSEEAGAEALKYFCHKSKVAERKLLYFISIEGWRTCAAN